jgi:hypothetical protein
VRENDVSVGPKSCSHVLSSGGHVITITLTMTRLTLIIVFKDYSI